MIENFSRQRLVQTATGHTALSLVDQVVVSGTRFATTILVGRLGSDAELGIYSLAFSILVVIISCQESLISIPYTVFVRRFSKDEQSKLSGSSLAQAALLNGISILVLLAACVVVSQLQLVAGLSAVLLTMALVLPFLMLREFARRFAFAHLEVRAALALDLSASVLQLAGLGLLAIMGPVTAVWAYAITGMATAVAVVVWLQLARGDFHFQKTRFTDDWLKNWRFGKWVFSAHLVSVVHMYLVLWWLASVIDETAAGQFTACMTVVVLANPFILGVSNVLSPKAAHAFADRGPKAVGQIVWRFGGMMALVLTGFAILFSWVGSPVIVALFGAEYAGNGMTIAWLAWGTLALAFSYAAASGLRAIDRPQTNFSAGLVGLVVTVVTAALMIDRLGVRGAAAALVAGLFAMATYRVIALQLFLVRARRNDNGENSGADQSGESLPAD